MKIALAPLFILTLVVFSPNINAEVKTVPIPAYCVPLQNLEDVLSEHDELPVIRAKSFRESENQTFENALVLFVNQQKKTWTLVEKVSENSYCVIAIGHDLEPVPNSIIEDIQKRRSRSRS
jgi:hypothetical protein